TLSNSHALPTTPLIPPLQTVTQPAATTNEPPPLIPILSMAAPTLPIPSAPLPHTTAPLAPPITPHQNVLLNQKRRTSTSKPSNNFIKPLTASALTKTPSSTLSKAAPRPSARPSLKPTSASSILPSIACSRTSSPATTSIAPCTF